MLLIVPHKRYIPNIGTEQADPTHINDFLPEDFRNMVLAKLQTQFKLLSFDKIQNSLSFDCFLQKL